MKVKYPALFLFFILMWNFAAYSQDSLQFFNHSRNEIKLTGMKVLGGWAVGNIVVGTVGYYNSTGAVRSFHQMNITWNTINLGIATAGFFASKNAMHQQYNAEDSWRDQRKLERTFLINGGLDLLYISSGLILRQRGNLKNSDRLRGYGSSVILQGAFLLLFDATMYRAERTNGKKFIKLVGSIQPTFDGHQAGFSASF